MKKLFIALLCAPLLAFAPAPNCTSTRRRIKAQRHGGAAARRQVFVNYCLNCHSASYLRYNRLNDIGLTEEQIKDNLLFTADKVGETMTIAMQRADAKDWFGAPPPDLTVIARARASEFGSGADWLYTYLRGFYRDDARPTGWNNVVFANVGMPHVLWELQGEQVDGRRPQAATGQARQDEACGIRRCRRRPGRFPELDGRADGGVPQESRRDRSDRAGPVLFVFAYALKREYWKDIH